MFLTHSLNKVEIDHPFFPNPIFGAVFITTITLFLVVASVIDARTLKIPKWLTIPLLGLGLFVNLVRGTWLASEGYPVWLFTSSSGLVGAADGTLFALTGAVLGFAVFLLFWLARICGGGDVKLVASVCAWVGPELGMYVIAISTSLVCIWILVLFLVRFAGPLAFKNAKRPTTSERLSNQGVNDSVRPNSTGLRGRRISFSLPVAVATLIVGFLL